MFFVGVIYFKFIKPNVNQEPKTQQAPKNQPVQVQPQQEHCTDTHDIQYWREYAEEQNQPQYKVDWLEESLIGVDLGIKDLAITSDGQKFQNNKYLRQSEKKRKRLQRQLSRKTKGSRNRNKARRKVARLHEKIRNQRNDTMHKATTELVRNYDGICIEDLNVRGMIKNHKRAEVEEPGIPRLSPWGVSIAG